MDDDGGPKKRTTWTHLPALRLWQIVVFALALTAAPPAFADEEHAEPARQGWEYAVPVANILLINGSIWATARYVLEMDYAYIGMDTVAANFASGFEWDSDPFSMNQLAHPYHGGLYHTGARVVGFGFWASSAYTTLGSLQWEMFMENEIPSYNDFVTTTVGGIVLGEVTLRLSSMLIDESTGGFERGLREAGALVLSPLHGLNRIFTGAAFRQGAAEPGPPLSFRLAAGVDRFDANDGDAVTLIGASSRLEFGSFGPSDEAFAPFDWFTMVAGADYSNDDSAYAVEFDVTGLLARWNVDCGDANECAWGPTMHYDYYDTPVFKVGSSSVGMSALGSFDLGLWSLQLEPEVDLGLIILGGLDSPYADTVDRDYNLGSGGFGRALISLKKPGWFQLRAITSRYYVHTLDGADGDELAGITRGELEVPVYAGFGVALGVAVYDREGLLDDYATVKTRQVSTELQLVWRPLLR